ncbi:hypothetical protein [Streptomyces sp. OR43]|uniref:hypothetical protein n=1 Tax=Streptomyces sp. or43 TaxID=2478957 RepID=UPI0011CD9B87|nr:hypothetical protein [Streptomyces sp. or43]TXS44933.1 hypothetical protein EAO72_07885 [Streptomyces sp. or43]
MSVMTENKTETAKLPGDYEPVAFQDVHEGDTLSFSRRDNGFGGSGNIVTRTGTVTKVTDKTVTVECGDLWGETGILRRANWNERDVHRITKATRRPYNVENVQYVDDGLIVTAVWVSDPTIEPAEALHNILRQDLPYEVVQVAEATRHFKREGADFSGWIIARGSDYSDQPIARKRDAVKALRNWAEGYFAR